MEYEGYSRRCAWFTTVEGEVGQGLRSLSAIVSRKDETNAAHDFDDRWNESRTPSKYNTSATISLEMGVSCNSI